MRFLSREIVKSETETSPQDLSLQGMLKYAWENVNLTRHELRWRTRYQLVYILEDAPCDREEYLEELLLTD